MASSRRWSLLHHVAMGVVILGFAVPIGAIVVVGSVPSLNSDQNLGPVLGWAIGAGVLFLIAGNMLEGQAQGRMRAERFAGGCNSVGIVEFVNEEPNEVGGISTFTLVISVEISESVRIYRRLYSNGYPADSRAQLGQSVIFRHATLDPDDLEDIQFGAFVS